ncbi:MAG TPA: DUF1772 domain-containing protein, partial [Phytomonospora sp.]
MTRFARFLSLLFSGLFAGFLTAVLILELSLRGFDGSAYTQVRLVELDALDILAVVTLGPALLATALVVFRTFRTDGRWLPVTALLLLISVFVLTLVVNLPINADQLDWSVASPPADWTATRDRWQVAHAVRTVAGVAAFGALITA